MLAQRSPASASCPTQQRTYIQLCGALVVDIGGRRVEALLPGRKGRQLFACLVISRNRPMSRDELIDVIWHTDSPADPDATLSTLLTRMRTAVGHDLIRGRGQVALELGADASVDWEVARASVATAEQRLAGGDARGALEHATAGLEIARRPLLPGISTPWLEDRRRELVDASVALLETAGRAALRLGGEYLPLAERSARELIEREPYRESGYALLMETHAARGNVAEALRVYDVLRRLLREELGLTPAAGVTAVAGRLLESEDMQPSVPAVVDVQDASVPLPPALACASRAPLVGRRAELERLLASVYARTPGSYRMLVISGSAGIGKTRLAGAVAAAAHDHGCDVLYGRVHRPPVAMYQPVVEALRRYLGHDDSVARGLADLFGSELTELARHLPELRRAVPTVSDGVLCDVETRRARVFDAVAGLLEAIARRRPVLFVLEDVQWADPLTLGLIRHAVRASHGARLSLLLTARDEEIVAPELRALFLDVHRERALEHVALGALCEAETAELIAAHRGRPPERAERRSLFADSGGNPFLVEELLLGSATHPLLRAG